MVDDDDVRGERLAACLHHEAPREMAATAAEAVLAGRGRERPRRGVLRHGGELALVAGLRLRGEPRDRLEIRGVRARGEAAVVKVPLEVMVADVVRPALEQRCGHRQAERRADRGKVAVKQLILKGLGPRRDDHFPADEQRGYEVGDGLAGPSARLGEQDPSAAHRLRRAHGELALLLAIAVLRDRAAERTLRREDRFELGLVRGHGISSTFTHTDELPARAPDAPERTPDCERVAVWSIPPSWNHSPSRPLAVATICWTLALPGPSRPGDAVCGAISRNTRSPDTRGIT